MSGPPYFAEHIGSLKRPAELLKVRADLDAGKATKEDLKPVEDKAIAAAVKMQQEVGLKAITDGEFGRHMFYDGMHDHLEGYGHVPDVPSHQFMMYVPDVAAFMKLDFKKADSFMCTSKIKRTKPCAYGAEFERLKSLVKPEEVKSIKITMAAPEWFHLRHGQYAYPSDVYANDDEHFADIAKAYREELQYLYSLGCRNIQIDDPLLAYFCAESMLDGMKKAGVDSEKLLSGYISLYNQCLEGHPKDMTVGLHLCRGNFKDGRHFSEGSYDRIAARMFNDMNFDVYYLEYDTDRAGGFGPLASLPNNKRAILGVISSKKPELESMDYLKEKIDAAAESMVKDGRTKEEALKQLGISPQCGFASHSEGNLPNEQ